MQIIDAGGGTPYSGDGPTVFTPYLFTLITPTASQVNGQGSYYGLTEGEYSYFVSDSVGCNSDTVPITVSVINPLSLVVTPDSQGVCISALGAVSREVVGGTPPFTFYGSDTTNLTAGTYSYVVVDSNGCYISASAILTEYQCITATVTPPDSGKVNTALGAELTSLYESADSTNGTVDPANVDSTVYSLVSNDRVRIEVIANENRYDTLLYILTDTTYGMTDLVDNGDSTLIITGTIPIANLTRLLPISGRFNIINYVRPYISPINNTGLIETGGDSAIRGGYARRLFNVDGEGIKVGVISDSYNKSPGNKAAIDITNGDLPGGSGNTLNPYPVEVLKDLPYASKADEGRAMLQIVHDIAPKAQLAFRTGFISSGDMAEGIQELVDAGCDIIVDDISYVTEPFFTDGTLAPC